MTDKEILQNTIKGINEISSLIKKKKEAVKLAENVGQEVMKGVIDASEKIAQHTAETIEAHREEVRADTERLIDNTKELTNNTNLAISELSEKIEAIKQEVSKVAGTIEKPLSKEEITEIVIQNMPELPAPKIFNKIVREIVKEQPKIVKSTVVREVVQNVDDIRKDISSLKTKKIKHSGLKGIGIDDHHPEGHQLESHIVSDMSKKLVRLISRENADDLHTHEGISGTIPITSGGYGKAYWNKSYLRLDCSNDPLTENLEIGVPLTGTRMLTVQTTDDGLGTSGILIPDANFGRGSWINPNGQDGVQVDATGTIAGAMNQRLWFQYYSSGDLDLCFGGGDIDANAANFQTTGAVQFNGIAEYINSANADYLDLHSTKDTRITCGADYTLLLNPVVWNDINMSMVTAKVPAANFPTWTAFTANLNSYTFAIDDYVDMSTAEILHDYKEGTNLGMHIHLVTNGLNDATARKVKYIIYYSWGDMDEAMSAEASLTAEQDIIANLPDKTHLLLDMGDIAGGTYKINSLLKFRVKRVAGTGTEPANDPFVEQIGIHYQIDTVGSRTEFIK